MSSVVKPLVSVRLMVYNNEPFIREAVESILMQKTEFKVEIVVGDDFSTDNTLDIIRSYKNTNKINFRILDRPIKGEYWRKRKNKNASVRTNFIDIIENCSGEYIALLDGDDYWTDPLKLQKQVDFLESNEDYVLCFHPCDYLISTSKVTSYIQPQALDKINYDYSVKNLLINWNIPTASMVFRNNEIEFPEWFNNVASGDIALAMLLYNKGKFKLLKEWMSVYRKNGLGISLQHVGFKMIHKRALLYYHLNEFFNFKYEQDIYYALNQIYIEFSNQKELKSIKKTEQSFFKRVIKKIWKKIKQN